MLSNRRTELDIIHDILTLTIRPQKKTHIVYLCNLNFKIVKKYLNALITNGYLELQNKLYTTTESGSTFLQDIQNARARIKRLVP